MRDWPFLLLASAEEDLGAAEDWLAEQLADEAAEGTFRGLRVERPFPGAAHLILSFRDRGVRDVVAARLAAARRAGGAPAVVILEAGAEVDRDWVADSEALLQAVPLGRHYQALAGDVAALPDRRPLRIPRSRAFGTGEHASTRLAAALVEEHCRRGLPMLDLGCGTAILAAVAHGEGCRPVVALDSDPDAALIAARTAHDNQLTDCLVACGGIEALAPGWRFATIAANIERDTLVALMPALSGRLRPDGRLVLSGLLAEQAEAVLEAGAACGLVEDEQRGEDGWTALVLAPNAALRPRALVDERTEVGREITLEAEEAHHLSRVRRVRDGSPVQVLNGAGRVWGGHLRLGPGARARVVDLSEEHPDTESSLDVTLLQAVPEHGGRMEEIVRQATELGARRVVAIISSRCQGAGLLLRGARAARWRRVAAEALKQSGRVRLPVVDEPVPFETALRQPFDGLSLLLDPLGPPLKRRLRSPAPPRLRLLIGPEGGFTTQERRAAREAGFEPCSLGRRILRAPTAAVAALAAVLTAWEDEAEEPPPGREENPPRI